MSETHASFMREAIALARDSVAGGGGPFGAVVVDPREGAGGNVVGRGQNRVVPACDPTAHAEIVAIREACARLGTFSLAGMQLYTSCEPCPMCLAAVMWARLDTVFYAGTRGDAAAAGFDDSHFYEQVCRPMDARQLPMKQLLGEDALAAFRLWQASPNAVRY